MSYSYQNNTIQFTVNHCTLNSKFPTIKKPVPPPPKPQNRPSKKAKQKKPDDDCEKNCMLCNFKCNWDSATIARLQRDLTKLSTDLKQVRTLVTNDEKEGELIADIDDDPTKNPKFPYRGDGTEGIREQVTALSNQLNAIAKNIGVGDIIVSHPIDWELKAEHHREQLAVIYLEDLGNNKYGKTPYTIHIPHFDYSKFASLTKSSFPIYNKGNVIGIFTLSDNSKIIVNCVDRNNAEQVINTLKTFVKPSYLQGGWFKPTERKDDLKTFRAIPYKVEYYIEGSKSSTIETKYLQ